MHITVCGNAADTTDNSKTDTTAKTEASAQNQSTSNTSENTDNAQTSTGTVDNHLTEDTDALVSIYVGKFTFSSM